MKCDNCKTPVSCEFESRCIEGNAQSKCMSGQKRMGTVYGCQEPEGSGASPCSGGLTNKQFIELQNYVSDPKNGWTSLGSSHQDTYANY